MTQLIFFQIILSLRKVWNFKIIKKKFLFLNLFLEADGIFSFVCFDLLASLNVFSKKVIFLNFLIILLERYAGAIRLVNPKIEYSYDSGLTGHW